MQSLYYMFKMFWQKRLKLIAYLNNPSLQLATLTDLVSVSLKKRGIKAVILDFDGVLAGHGAVQLTASIQNWLLHCVDTLGPKQVFILSNQATLERQQYFADHFKNVHFHMTARKKPHPQGILEILEISHLHPLEVVMIDDRLMTGILAAVLADVPAIWITNPFITWAVHPVHEAFFYILRVVEKKILKYS